MELAPTKGPSKFWYVGHVFLGLITGVICYVIWKNDNKPAARKHLVRSLVIMIVIWVAYPLSVFYVTYPICEDVYSSDGVGTPVGRFCAGFLSSYYNYSFNDIFECTNYIVHLMTEEEYANYSIYIGQASSHDIYAITDEEYHNYVDYLRAYPPLSLCASLPG